MHNMQQISRQDSNSTSSDDDAKDRTDAKYKNFKNQSERGSQKSTESEIDPSTIDEFINPVFKPAENDKDKQSYDTPKTNYDNLTFSNNTQNKNHQSPASKRKPTPKARTDITKPPEEYEMGVSNYGYHNENPRPDSWNKSLSFSPYAIDTPISGPTEHRGSSLSIPPKRHSGSSKHSDYSFVSADSENPYAAPSDKVSAYDTIPGQELAQKGRLPPPRQPTKKANLAYESAVIKHTQVHRETVKPDNPKEGYAEDEHSNCCHTIFIVLVGIIALIGLVMCFLIVFGTISVKKCKECDIVDIPQTAKQTGGNSGNNDALLREIETLRKNITALHQTLSKMSKPENHTAKIVLLESELAGQKIQVASLTNELAKQKNITKTLDETIKMKRKAKQGSIGLQGRDGFNGSAGLIGNKGLGLDFAGCQYIFLPRNSSDKDTLYVQQSVPKGQIAVGAYCGSSTAKDYTLSFKEKFNFYECACSVVTDGNLITCEMNLFVCPEKPV